MCSCTVHSVYCLDHIYLYNVESLNLEPYYHGELTDLLETATMHALTTHTVIIINDA